MFIGASQKYLNYKYLKTRGPGGQRQPERINNPARLALVVLREHPAIEAHQGLNRKKRRIGLVAILVQTGRRRL
jgi:hypothetical protein